MKYMIDTLQTMQGLKSYAEYLQNRMKDLVLANDKLREDLNYSRIKYNEMLIKYKNEFTSPDIPNPYHKIRKLEKENAKLRTSIYKVYLKYIEPKRRKSYEDSVSDMSN